ncbi:redoxin domain-containing protein [Bacillus marinisedimentorum]
MPLSEKGLKPGQPCPPFSLPAIDGRTYSLETFRGKPLLLHFMRGTW